MDWKRIVNFLAGPLGFFADVGRFASNKIAGTDYRNRFDDFGNFVKTISEGGSSMSDLMEGINSTASELGGALQSWVNTQTQQHMTGAQIEQNEWTAQREDTAYQRAVADMEAAGLNPAMMYGRGGQPAASSPSASPSNAGLNMSDLIQLLTIKPQIELLKANAEKARADAENTNTDTAFDKATMDARIEAENWKVNNARMTNEEISTRIETAKANIDKLIAETNSEEYKQMLYESQRWLNVAERSKIEVLLPFEKLYIKAQTDNQREQAAYNAVLAAYQHGLINEGYIEQLVGKTKAEAAMADLRATLINPKYESQFGLADDAPNWMRGLVSIFGIILKSLPFTNGF